MKKQNEMAYERELDLWQYQMPYESMSKKDVREMERYNIMMIRSYLQDGDYIIGTWNNILDYMSRYLMYEMNKEYMNPLYVGKRALD